MVRPRTLPDGLNIVRVTIEVNQCSRCLSSP